MPRDLRILVGAVGLSTLGDAAALTALVLLVHEGTGSSLAVAALLLGMWGPVVALGGVAGALADRVENTRLLVLGAAGQALVVLAMVAAGSPQAAVLLAPLLGLGSAVVQPAEFALVPVAARRLGAAAAGARVETARYAGMSAGPFVGGGLAGAGDVRAALALNLLTFVAVAVAASRLTVRRAGGPAPAEAARPRARDGAAALARDPVLATALGGALASLLLVGATIVALVAFATETLGLGGPGYGALVGVWTAGMVAGAVGVARRVPPAAHAAAALAAVVAQGAGILAGAAVAAIWAVALGYLVGGAAQGAKNVLLRALIHERVAAEMHGRAFAAYNSARNAAELAALLGGAALVAATGPRWTLVVAGAGSAAVGLAALAVLRRTAAARARRAAAVDGARRQAAVGSAAASGEASASWGRPERTSASTASAPATASATDA